MVNSVTCADIAQSHCGEGGNVPGARNLEEGVDVSVCLSALWFLLTIRKPCWSVPRRLAAPGDTLLSWGSSSGHFFGIGYIGQNVLCVDFSLLCPVEPR